MTPGYYGEDIDSENDIPDESDSAEDGPLWTAEEEAWRDAQGGGDAY